MSQIIQNCRTDMWLVMPYRSKCGLLSSKCGLQSSNHFVPASMWSFVVPVRLSWLFGLLLFIVVIVIVITTATTTATTTTTATRQISGVMPQWIRLEDYLTWFSNWKHYTIIPFFQDIMGPCESALGKLGNSKYQPRAATGRKSSKDRTWLAHIYEILPCDLKFRLMKLKYLYKAHLIEL